ncbi:MAG: response regulator [Lentisphaeraceae bacterium]|nr:response regulator [Lentisphaeraceae bacterium]
MSEEKYDVLFVDDDPNILKAIKRNLRGKFEICTSETIEDAIDKIKTHTFPVVVSDMKMPVMNGADFLILVRETQPEAIRILLTGESGLEEAIKAINESDIFKFLKKPCPTEVLIENINSALRIYNAKHIEELLMEKSVKGFVLIISELMNIISPEIFKKSSDIRRIIKSPRTSFPIKDEWSVEVAALLMYLGSINYKIYSYEKIFNTEAMSKILYKSASLIFKIPKFEEVHNILYDLACFYEDQAVINALDCDSKVLKLIIDYYHMVSHANFKEKFVRMYNKDILSAIPDMLGKTKKSEIIEIGADKLEANMTAAENIITVSGSILINKGDTITDNDIVTLLLFSSKNVLVEPFKVERGG